MSDRELMQQALEALTAYDGTNGEGKRKRVLAALRERLAQPDAYGYASRLAVAIWKKHYMKDAPQWKPLDDLMGVLTQIDNMTSGLTRLAQPEFDSALQSAAMTQTVPKLEQPEPTANDGWLQDGSLLYRLTDEHHPQNRDEINVTMADGSRSIESRTRRAGELLDRIRGVSPQQNTRANSEVIPEQILEPEQEPVAWQWLDTGTFRKSLPASAEPDAWRALYTTPPRREWVGLTDEVDELAREMVKGDKSVNWLARAIEAKLREKNA